MIKINFNRHFLISLSALGLVLLLESFTDIDLAIQKHFYDNDMASWLISPEAHRALRTVFYDGPKIVLAVIGIAALICFFASFKKAFLKSVRRPALLLFLSLMLVPLIVAGGKQVTNIYCPKDLVCFNGSMPYNKVLSIVDSASIPLKKGKCFPAGHATGGFALMALFFCFKNKKMQLSGLSIGVIIGWIMGSYQMLRGEHFLSHTLASMTASWIVILCLAEICINYPHKQQ